MLSKQTGIIVAVLAAAIITALLIYGMDIAGEQATRVGDVAQP